MLSEAKARKIGEEHGGAIIVASDLFVVLNNEVFEKPKDKDEAKQMLGILSNSTFEIITGLAVCNSSTQIMLSTSESCSVEFRKLNDAELDDYIAKYPILKCAAAFEADGLLRFAKSVNGNYNFKAGLPVNKLIEFLRELGINV